jgi:hypothetical protein
VGVAVGVIVGVDVDVCVGVRVGVCVGVDVGLFVGVVVGVLVGVCVGVCVGVLVGLFVGVIVGVSVGVGVNAVRAPRPPVAEDRSEAETASCLSDISSLATLELHEPPRLPKPVDDVASGQTPDGVPSAFSKT